MTNDIETRDDMKSVERWENEGGKVPPIRRNSYRKSSTLAMCALLLIVAFSNLEARDKELYQAALQKTDAAHDAESASPKQRVA